MAIDVTTAPRRIARPVRRVVDGARTPEASTPRTPQRAERVTVLVLLALIVAMSVGMLLRPRELAYAPPIIAALGVAMLLLVAVDRRRSRISAARGSSASMLVDLRDRLRELGDLPTDLPCGWHAESSIQPAFGDAFSGDFLVASHDARERLDLALVDVSGKGLHAGSRSVLLSGAFAGLLDATSPSAFLPAANSYLVRQHWAEGFATAIHLSVDLETGVYDVGSAGHPAAVHYQAATRQWSTIDGTDGVLLGVVDSDAAQFDRVTGQLERGDALLLYTDGIIEDRDCDLTVGMNRMLGAANRDGGAGTGVADRICAAAMSGDDDDRAVVVIWRD